MTVYNKVMYGENVLIDLTEDTAVESAVADGVVFHRADGVRSIGTLLVHTEGFWLTDGEDVQLADEEDSDIMVKVEEL